MAATSGGAAPLPLAVASDRIPKREATPSTAVSSAFGAAFVGAGAVVTCDVKPFALVVGVPARQIGWMSTHGERVDLPLVGMGVWICPHTGETYRLAEQQLTHTPA